MSIDHLRNFQQAAAAVIRQLLPDSHAVKCIVVDQFGREVVLPIPAGLESLPAAGEAPVPESGWRFTETRAFFDGRMLESVYGRKLAVLRALHDATGPLTAKDLRMAAWNDMLIEENTVRWQVGDLRKALAVEFSGYEGEIIATANGGGRPRPSTTMTRDSLAAAGHQLWTSATVYSSGTPATRSSQSTGAVARKRSISSRTLFLRWKRE